MGSAGRVLNRFSGSKTLLFSRLSRPVGATDYSIPLVFLRKRPVGGLDLRRDCSLVSFSMRHYGPGNPRRLVGQCDRHNHARPFGQ